MAPTRSAPAPPSRLLALLAAARGRRVVALGDLIADEFVSGRIARVSREAPVLILEYDSTEILPGGAGNAAANVAALGGIASLVALAGRDDAGRRVLAACPARVGTRSIVRPAGYHTPVKTRILAGGVHSAKQQVVRIDRRTREPIAEPWRAAWLRAAARALKRADAVLVSDYGSGLLSPALVTTLVVTGAGDTVMATLTLALAAGASLPEAARLANYAGGLVVMKRGTATVSARELARAVTADAAGR